MQLPNNANMPNICYIYKRTTIARKSREEIRSYIKRFANFTNVFRREAVVVPVEPTMPEILRSTKHMKHSTRGCLQDYKSKKT